MTVCVRVVFVAEQDCRATSVEKAASEFCRYASSRFLNVEVKTSADKSSARNEFPGCFVVRTMEGQERHGRHKLLVPDNADELYVELASYRYDSAPASHFIKFEMGSVSYEHPLTQEFFSKLVRCLEQRTVWTSQDALVRYSIAERNDGARTLSDKAARPTCDSYQQCNSRVVDRRYDQCDAESKTAQAGANNAAERERQQQIVVPAYRKYLENPGKSVEEWMGQNALEVPCTTVALVGLPKCGKSTMINQFGCVVAQELIPQLVSQGGGVGDGGHNTLQQRRIDLMAKACEAITRPAPPFELTMCDLVGVRCLRELWCALLGKTADRERWPVHPGMSADEEENVIRKVEARVRSPLDAVHCLVLVMTPNTLLNMDPLTMDTLAGILRMAKEFHPNTDTGVEPFALPLRLVISHADVWARLKGCDDARCLLGGAEGFLGPLYAAARKLGFDPLYVTPIGWLDRDDIDHANGADPRMVVMKFLLHQMRMQSTSHLRDVLAVVGQKRSDSGA